MKLLASAGTISMHKPQQAAWQHAGPGAGNAVMRRAPVQCKLNVLHQAHSAVQLKNEVHSGNSAGSDECLLNLGMQPM